MDVTQIKSTSSTGFLLVNLHILHIVQKKRLLTSIFPLDECRHSLPLHWMEARWTGFFLSDSFLARRLSCSLCAAPGLENGPLIWKGCTIYSMIFRPTIFPQGLMLSCDTGNRKWPRPKRQLVYTIHVFLGKVLQLRCNFSTFSYLDTLFRTLAPAPTWNDSLKRLFHTWWLPACSLDLIQIC